MFIFRYDAARSMESLETVWVSKANALQRRGRAGRVMSGVCFHLFTNHRFENVLREQPIPGNENKSLILHFSFLSCSSDQAY